MLHFIRATIFLFFLLSGLTMYGQDIQFIPRLMPPKGHTGPVYSSQYSPDGNRIVTASGDGTAKVWDAQSGKLIHDLTGHTDLVPSVQYSPDGNRIVTASRDKTVKVWDALSGKLIHDLVGHTGMSWSAQYSPDGNRIVTTSWDKTAKVWDNYTGNLIYDLAGHTSFVSSAQYSPDGKQIVTSSNDSTAKVWDAQNGKLINNLIGHTGLVMSAQYSPDGKQIVTASWDKIAKVWDAYTGKLIYDLAGHTSSVYFAQYSPDGEQIVTSSNDSTAKVWDAQNGKLVHNLIGHTSSVYFAHYSPDGKQIITASADKTAKVWDVQSGKLIHDLTGHKMDVLSVKFSPDGKQMVTTSNDNTPKVWDAQSGKLIHNLTGHTMEITSIQFSPGGKQILMASGDSKAKVWDTQSGKLIHNLTGHTDVIRSAQFNPDGKQIVTASGDKTAKVWDVQNGNLIHVLTGHKMDVLSAQYSPDGKQIVTASNDSIAKVWDAYTGKFIHDLIGHKAGIRSARYSPNGKQIMTASGDNTAKVWGAQSGKLIHDLIGHKSVIWSSQYSLDGNQIVTASGDSTAKVWDAHTGNLIHDLTGHSDVIWSAQFGLDGKQIATASWDKTAKVWDTQSGKLIHDLIGHANFVWNVEYSPNGKQIVTTSSDGIAKVWDSQNGKLIHDLVSGSGVDYAQYNNDGTLIILRLPDGALSFWISDTGKELLKLYPLDESNWVVIHPSGLFDASPNAMKWMYYKVGQEVIELEQLKERYYEPGLYEKVMAMDGTELRNVDIFQSLEMYPEMVSQIENDELQIHLKERNGGIGKVSLFINNKEVLADANAGRDTLISIDLKQFEKYYLTDTLNIIGVRTYNADGWLKSQLVTLDYDAAFIGKKGTQGVQPLAIISSCQPNYYAIVVGTSDYNGDQLDLRYADKDSKDIASALRQTADILFGKERVHLEWFSTDTQSGSKMASKENIKTAFETFSTTARPEDVLTIYFSGHGVTYGDTESEQFYYLTKDMLSGDLSDPAIRSNYAISTEELTQWVTAIPAQKQVMILDACSSGKVVEDLLAVRDVPTSQIRALDRMKDRTGMFVLAGSAADKVSYEASQFGQGLLTYSLLLGMSGGALREGRSVDVMQLFQFARDRVPEFAKDIGGIQTPTLAFPTHASSFDIGLVTEEVDIPLQEVKPVFIRSVFQEEENFEDIIGLSEALDQYLIDASTGSSSKGVIFVDVNKYDEAYSIKGRYVLNNNQAVIKGGLFKSKEKVGSFEISGGKDDIGKIVQKIIAEVNSIVDHQK